MPSFDDLTPDEIIKKETEARKTEKLKKAEDAEFWKNLAEENNEWTKKEAEDSGLSKHPIITSEELLQMEFPPQQWIIDKFLPEGGITMIVGEAGTLKSYISLYMAKILLSGEKLFGQFETYRKCKILLIDKENKLARIQRRLISLGAPASPEMWIIKYPETFILEDKEWVEYIKNFILENSIDVVIFDSFIDFFTGNENSSTDTAQVMNAIRSLSPTAQYILIHHDSKPVPRLIRSAAQKTRGSSNIIAQVDTQFYFEKGKDNKTLLIEQGKSRDEEPIPKFEVSIISGIDTGIQDFTYKGEVKSEVRMVEEAKEFLFNYIQNNPMISKEELFDAATSLGCSNRTLQNALSILKNNGLIDSLRKPAEGNKMFYISLEKNSDEDGETI